jgi:hypothetical protein
MDSDYRPLDLASAMALVKRAVRELDESTLQTRDLLLADLLCAAWPTPCGQDQ